MRTPNTEGDGMGDTYVTVIGNVVTDPVLRRTESAEVVSFRVASTERFYDRAAENWQDGRSFFVTVSLWGKPGVGSRACFAKGDPVIAHGKLRSRSYEKEGVTHWTTDLRAVAVGPDLARSIHRITRLTRAEEKAAYAKAGYAHGSRPGVDVDESGRDGGDVGTGAGTGTTGGWGNAGTSPEPGADAWGSHPASGRTPGGSAHVEGAESLGETA